MQLTEQRRKETGAFYTPEVWAKKAVEYLEKALPQPLSYYVWYDPAGGEGALLEALPHECVKFGSTLEAEDVEIMRYKGIDAMQFDFLDDDLSRLPSMIHKARDMGRLVVFMNPPYFKLKASHKCFAKEEYKCTDSVYLFYYRIFYELMPQYLGSFNKMDILQCGSSGIEHSDATITSSVCLGGFMSHSKTWGLKGTFPIAFNMFELSDMEAYYGAIGLNGSGYKWSLDIYDEKYQLKPYKKPSVRATMSDDTPEEQIQRIEKMLDAKDQKEYNRPVWITINEWIKMICGVKSNRQTSSTG